MSNICERISRISEPFYFPSSFFVLTLTWTSFGSSLISAYDFRVKLSVNTPILNYCWIYAFFGNFQQNFESDLIFNPYFGFSQFLNHKIDNLFENRINLTLKQNKTPLGGEAAAQETQLNSQSVKWYIDAVPSFIGTANSFWVGAIISKLKGNALMLDCSCPEVRDRNQLKSNRGLSFGDQRDLVKEIIILKHLLPNILSKLKIIINFL